MTTSPMLVTLAIAVVVVIGVFVSHFKPHIKKRTAHMHEYLRYKFPILNTFYKGSPLLRSATGTTVLLVLVSAVIYAVIGEAPNPKNSVFDSLIAIPIQVSIVIAGYVVIVGFRILFYRGTTGSYEENRHHTQSVGENYPWLPLNDVNSESVIFDCSAIAQMVEMHPFVASAIRFTLFDKDDNFRIEAGTLNVPKCSLSNIIIRDGKVIFSLQSVSYYDVFYTHYFADYELSHEGYEENNHNKIISLRSLFGASARDYIDGQIAKFPEARELRPYPVFTNPLGLTGVCFYKKSDGERIFIGRERGDNVANEARRLDWSFSGIVEAHPLVRSGGAVIDVRDFIDFEIQDELFEPLLADGSPPLADAIQDIFTLGVCFSEKYLYQPELVVLVELRLGADAINFLEKYTHSKGKIRLINESALRDPNVLRMKAKDLFAPIRNRVIEYLDAGPSAPSAISEP
jgi:hypothetical protein